MDNKYLLLILYGLLAGCGGGIPETPADLPFLKTESFSCSNLNLLNRLPTCEHLVVKTNADWNAIWCPQKNGDTCETDVPKIDFSKNIVVGVSAFPQDYLFLPSVKIQKILEYSNYVEVVYIVVNDSSLRQFTLTKTYSELWVTIPKTDKPITFKLNNTCSEWTCTD